MWRQMKTVLSFVGIHPIVGIFGPSWPLNIAIEMAPVLSWTVSSRTSTSGVCQDSFRNPGAGKSRICQDNGREYMQVCLGTPLWTLHRTTKPYSQINADWKVGKAQYAEFNVPTCGKIAAWQLCRETQPLWNSHDSWWPELKMLGSMPWCSFPWHKLLAMLAQTNCLIDLTHEFTSLFLPKVIYADLPRKAFPQKHALLDMSVFPWLRKQRPRFAQGQPKGYSQLKELHRTIKAIGQMHADWKVEGPVCWVQCASMCQDCSLTAVQRNTAFVEQSWFMMAWT